MDDVTILDTACTTGWPVGFALARDPADLAVLFEANIQAVTLAPRDAAATQFFCERIGALSGVHRRGWPKIRPDKATMARDVLIHYLPHEARSARPKVTPLWAERQPGAWRDPRWQDAWQEIGAVTAAIATTFVAKDESAYGNAHLASYQNAHNVDVIHPDPGFVVTGTLARAPTRIWLGGRLYAAPPYHYTFFKGTTLHCAPPYDQTPTEAAALAGVRSSQIDLSPTAPTPRFIMAWDVVSDRRLN